MNEPGSTHDTRRIAPQLAIAISAIQNGSTVPIDPDTVIAMLRTGVGEPSHLRALFGDTSLATLAKIAADQRISQSSLIASYKRAKANAAAANPELDELAGFGREI